MRATSYRFESDRRYKKQVNQEIINSIYNLLPELILAIAVISTSSLRPLSSNRKLPYYITLASLAIAFIFVLIEIYSPAKSLFNGLLVLDPFASFGKLAVLFTAFIIIAALFKPGNLDYSIILLMIFGALAVISSANLVMTFATLEVISIAIFLLLINERKTVFKYFTYSAVSSAVMLYGISLLYGLTGSLDYTSISNALSATGFNELTLTISVILIVCGLGFKLLLFPFNFIYPTLAEKLSYNKLALISVMPLTAVVIVTARFLLTAFHDPAAFITDANAYRMISTVKWQNLILIISAASIVAGNIIVLWQSDIKKIFSFIIISHAGYLLLPIALPSPDATTAFLIGLFSFASIIPALFICFSSIAKAFGKENIELNELKGLGKASPVITICIVIFLLCGVGLPLTIGFQSRIFALNEIFVNGYSWAGLPIILSMIVFIYFIIKFVVLLFSESELKKLPFTEPFHKVLLLSFLFFICLLGIYPTPVINLCKYCSIIIGL